MSKIAEARKITRAKITTFTVFISVNGIKDESKPNYNVFIKILKSCKDTKKMIALKNNRLDKWNSKWNKIYL